MGGRLWCQKRIGPQCSFGLIPQGHWSGAHRLFGSWKSWGRCRTLVWWWWRSSIASGSRNPLRLPQESGNYRKPGLWGRNRRRESNLPEDGTFWALGYSGWSWIFAFDHCICYEEPTTLHPQAHPPHRCWSPSLRYHPALLRPRFGFQSAESWWHPDHHTSLRIERHWECYQTVCQLIPCRHCQV